MRKCTSIKWLGNDGPPRGPWFPTHWLLSPHSVISQELWDYLWFVPSGISLVNFKASVRDKASLKILLSSTNFLYKILHWIFLPASASTNSFHKLLHKLVPVYQFNVISSFSSHPLSTGQTAYYFLHSCASLLLLFVIPDCNTPPNSLHSLMVHLNTTFSRNAS